MRGLKTLVTGALLALGIVLLSSPQAALAQAYPNKPIRLVVPFAAGGAADMVARLMGQAVGDRVGQSVIIENRPGAAGSIGSLAVARAAPDGYTILMTVISSHA